MAKASVTLTDLAREDLIELWMYIGEKSLSQADRFLDRIAQKLSLLARSPHAGRLRPELDPALRSFPVGNYLVFYRPTSTGIVVIRVLSGRRDIEKLLAPKPLAPRVCGGGTALSPGIPSIAANFAGLTTSDFLLSALDFRLSTLDSGRSIQNACGLWLGFAGTISPMLFEELRIRNVAIQPAHILAPMAGITDTVFRRFIKRLGGCGLIMTEFVSSEGMLRQNVRSQRYLYYTDEERPITAQVFGADPDRLAEAARMIEDLGFDLVDLNLGCPAKKVVKCGGSGLLRDLPLLKRIFVKIRAAVSIPFTVKIRAGWSDEEIVAVPVARLAQECGVEAVAVHPRTRLQGFSGRARWEIIAEVKAAVRIPVIGNGDVFKPQDAQALQQQTGCDAVMIGRAAATNPWIFRQMADYFRTGSYAEPTEADRHHLIRTYYQMLVEGDTPGALGKMKQFASWFTRGVRNGTELRRRVQSARDVGEVLERVDEFFRSAAPRSGTSREVLAC